MLFRTLLPVLTLLSVAPGSVLAQQEEERTKPPLVRLENVELQPATWDVGEFLEYEVRDPKGNAVGVFYTWSEPVEGDETSERLWTRRFNGVNDQVVGAVRVNRDTLQPSDSEIHPGPSKLLFATYGPEEVIVDAAGMSRNLPLLPDAYDSQTLIYLMRRLPLEAGTKMRLNVFDALTGSSSIRFDVEYEKIRMKSKRFQCWKVTSSTGLTCWISQDERRLPIWIQQGDELRCFLVQDTRFDAELGRFDSGPLACDLQAPPGWVLGHPKPATEKNMTATALCLREPASVYLQLTALQEGETRVVRNFANHSRSRAKKRYRGYRARGDSWVEEEVGGFPAISFTADYREGGEKGWVQRRSLIQTDRLLAEFVYRAPAAEFDRQSGVLPALVGTFQQRSVPVPAGD